MVVFARSHVVSDDAATHLRDLPGHLAALARRTRSRRRQPYTGVEDHAVSDDRATIADDVRAAASSPATVPSAAPAPTRTLRPNRVFRPKAPHTVDRDRFLPHRPSMITAVR
jgi:hypothetical protein